jgi:hypothetical protein
MLGAVFQQDTQEGLSPEEAGHNALLSAIGMLWGASGGESSISALGTIADLTKALSAGMGTGNFNGMMEALTTFANDKGVAASRMALPLSSLHSFAANLFDGKKRETYDPNKVIEFGKKIANGTFMRFALPPELGSMSEEVNNTQFLVRAMAGMSSTPTKSDRDELFNEAQRLGKAGYEVYPPDTRYKLTDPNSGLDIKLNGEQVQALQTADVAATRSLMQIAAQGDYYNSLPDVDKAAYLRSIASDPSIRATTLQLAKEMGLIGSDYEIKGVNASLTVDEQRILLEFGNKSETLKATDLENPKLAALYYAADYKNKEANGALTTDDTDLGKNGALYKMKVSEFNLANKIQPDAINGYGGANNTNIEDVNRANPELAKRIVLYDALLAENGLSGKNDSRYDMKFSSQADVFANDDFDFAALLSSLQYDTRKKNGRLDAGEDNYQYANASNLLFRKNRDIFLAENNIDKDLYRLYNDVSATDWKAMAKTDPELYEALWQLDKAMTDAKVSLRSSDHFRQKYERAGSSGGYGGGRSGGGGGSAKSAYTIGQIPSVEELRAKIMPVSKKGKTTTSMSIQGKSKMADLGFSNLKSKSTKSAGKGIKTEVTGYKASNTVKYSGSKTRQPNMGETYMAFLKGKTLQSSFTAQRKY